MKSATSSQFHELVAKILTNLDYKRLNFLAVQDFIKNLVTGIKVLIDFINEQPTSQTSGICIADSLHESPRFTTLRKGDCLVFYVKQGTVAVHRPSLPSGEERIYFRQREHFFDDKNLTKLTKLDEIMHACKLMALFIKDCDTAVLLSDDSETRGVIKIIFK